MDCGPILVTANVLDAIGGFTGVDIVVDCHAATEELKTLWLYKGWKILVHTTVLKKVPIHTRVMLWEERSAYKL